MTKPAVTKKVKKPVAADSDITDYDPSIFEVRDRHYGSLFAVKKKIRACEKKIRELEQFGGSQSDAISKKPAHLNQSNQSNTNSNYNNNQIESEEAKMERAYKLESKKMQLSIWKEAAVCIHTARKEELTQGITNVSMTDVVEGVDLLRQVLANEDKWTHYKCPNKKHLQKVDIERVRQLAHYLNIHSGSRKGANLSSFTSVVDYLSSPIAIGQECPMSFSEFVRLFDKLRRSLTVEIPVTLKETAIIASTVTNNTESASTIKTTHIENKIENMTGEISEIKIEATANSVANGDKSDAQKNNKNRSKRSPRNGQKPGRKSQPPNGSASSPSNLNNASNVNNASTNNASNNDSNKNTSNNKHDNKHDNKNASNNKHDKKEKHENASLPSIPEKLVVVVTSNAKNKQQDDLSTSTTTPTATSVEDVSKSSSNANASNNTNNVNQNKNNTKPRSERNNNRGEVPSGRLIHNPNVPTDDSDEEGWFTPAGTRQKRVVVETQDYRQSQIVGGSKRGGNINNNANERSANANNNSSRGGPRNGNPRGGNNNNRRAPNNNRNQNQNNNGGDNSGNFKNKRPQQQMNKTDNTAVIQGESQF